MPAARVLSIVALFAAVASAQTAPTSAPVSKVDNPTYVAWGKCRPGTSIEATLTRTQGAQTMTVGITSVLDGVGIDDATVSTTVTMDGMPPQTRPTAVPAKVDEDAVYNPQKVANMVRNAVGNEDVVIDGKTYPCKIIEMTGDVQGMAVKIRVWETMDIPGGFARIHSTIGPNQMNVDVKKINLKS